MLEENLRRGMLLSRGGRLAVAAPLIVNVMLPSNSKKRG